MPARKPLILSIDDDPDIRALIAATLEPDGIDVHCAASGSEGLVEFERLAPDLVLLDVMMPEMDGYEVCARLQRRDDAASTPVIFLTALGSETDRRKAFASGAVDHLVKPFDRGDLLSVVRKHLKTTEEFSAIVREAESWTERIIPDDYVRFRDSLSKRLPEGSAEREAILSAHPSTLYRSGEAVGLKAEQIAEAISEFLGLTFVPRLDPAAVVLDVLPVAFCRKNQVLPMSDPGGLIVFVLANPFNWELLDLLERRATSDGMAPNLAIAPADQIAALFRFGGISEDSERPSDLTVPDSGDHDITVLPSDVEAAPVVFIANNVILTAVRERASDIHLEPKADRMEIRFRVDGEMQDMLTVKSDTAAMLLSRLKALAQMDIAERRKPQDGSLETHIGGKRIKLRLATSSGPYGESMVIRLLEVTAKPVRLEALGFTRGQSERLYSFAERPHGLILMVGPTGSGKTTTIYSLLSSVDTERRALMTVEDPVEYIIPRANHQQVNDKAGVSFESLLKSSVRQDPDVLFLGEIRDAFSARTAVDFASTGHLTVSTLHTSNSTTAIFRLERLGVDRWIMADAILGIIAQRLVKQLCPECRSVVPITAEEREQLSAFTDEIPESVAHPVGCPKCKSGYKGRIGVQEILEFDVDIGDWLREGVPIAEIRQRIADRGDYLIANSVIDKVRDYAISPEDAWRTVLVEEQARPTSASARGGGAHPSAGPAAPEPAQAAGVLPEPAAPSVAVPTAQGASPRFSDSSLIGATELPKVRTGEHLIGGARRPRILVADDDASTRELIGRALGAEGYEVVFAHDGVQAFELVRRSEFDLVLSDVTMPHMDGMQLLEALSRSGIDVPVVMLTGVSDGEFEARALALGVSDYVGKPVRKDVLLLRVSRALRGSR